MSTCDVRGGTYERRLKEPAKVRQATLKQKDRKKGSKLLTEPRGLTGPELRELQPVSMDARASQSTTYPRGDAAPGQNAFVYDRAASTTPISFSVPAYTSPRRSMARQASSQQYPRFALAPHTQQQQTHSNNTSVIHNYYTVVNGQQPNRTVHRTTLHRVTNDHSTTHQQASSLTSYLVNHSHITYTLLLRQWQIFNTRTTHNNNNNNNNPVLLSTPPMVTLVLTSQLQHLIDRGNTLTTFLLGSSTAVQNFRYVGIHGSQVGSC